MKVKSFYFCRIRRDKGTGSLSLVDFQKVIDIKAAEWLNDPQWSKFLRPITLFGPNFESYLNQKQNVVHREGDFGHVN
jgi:uncharacterized phage protein (TIGR02220 family)